MANSVFNNISSMLFGPSPNRNRSPAVSYDSPFLLSWNIGALACLLLPWLLYLLIGGRNQQEGEEGNNWWNWGGGGGDENNDNNNEDGSSWWQRLFGGGEDNPERQGGGGAFILAYIYMLAIFVGLIWYGNRILRRGAFTLPLLTAMFVFWNMALLLVIVMGSSQGGDERQREENRGGMQILVGITAACMAIFIAIFFLLIRCRDHEYGVRYEGQLDPDYHDEEQEPQRGSSMFQSTTDGSNEPYSYNRDRRQQKNSKSGVFA